MRTLTLCALLALLALPAAALEPYLVKDIEPVPQPASSEPYFPVTFGKAVLFFADDGLSGRQLWRSDGTAAGTWPLSDASPGGLGYPEPFQVTERLYFFVDGVSFEESSLWVSDGTPAGTFRLTGPGVQVLDPPPLWMAGRGVLYFVARDAEHGDEPWRSDGTPAGTWRIADVQPGTEGSGIQGMAGFRGRVWFGADDGQHGGSLWSSDGTETGTALAVDPFPDSSSHGAPEFVSAVGDRIAFFAPPVGGGARRQLWAGDGTRRGTVPLQRFSGGEGRGVPDAVAQGNRLYFVAETRQGQELWVSDGTADGTRALTAFVLREAFGFFNSPDDFLSLPRQPGVSGRGGGFVFLADDGLHGVEPWITDGTPQGTRLIQDVCRGICSSAPELGPVLAGRLWFTAEDRASGRELWSTDGALTRLRDVCPGECSSSPEKIYVVGGRLLFAALGPQHLGELWTSDGTAAGTVRIGDFATDDIWYYGLVGAALDGRFVFSFDDGEHGEEPWIADLTPGGMQLVEDINRTDDGGSYARFMVPLGNQILFSVPSTGPNLAADLWKSDGTEAGTVRFAESVPEPDGAFAEVGGLLFYLTNAPWRTDGTAEGTFPLTDQSVRCCVAQEMQPVGSTVFFNVQDWEHGDELWASDGTVAGTRLVRDILPGEFESSEPASLTAFQGRLWFAARGPGTGRELWTSDGTEAGTVLFADIDPGGDYDSSAPDLLTVHAGRLWFFADDGEHGRELWTSDGTAAGTRLAVELVPGPGSFAATFLAPLGDRLVFSAYGQGLWVSDGTPAGTRKIHDREADRDSVILAELQGRLFYVDEETNLWVTDGTAAGTGPFLDRDGRPIFYPNRFAVLDGRLVFTAWDRSGATLWESDGTPAGTFPIELRVEASSYDLAAAGGRVFFSGHDPATGWELWAVRP